MTALIKKIYDAMENGEKTVTIKGTGVAFREFLHSFDLADAILHIMNIMHDKKSLPYHTINVGSGIEYSIYEYAKMIADRLNYHVDIKTDPSYPDGMPRKLLDITKIRKFGWEHSISICDGIDQMIMEYERIRAI